ncbi:MAG: acetate kinase [Planctomycetota bacterium]|jgi:acetate kinase
MIVLVINCGSSSIKYQLFRMPSNEVMASGVLERIGEDGSVLTHKTHGNKHIIEKASPNHSVGMEMILNTLIDSDVGVIQEISEIGAVGHRVVHGGEAYSGSVVLDEDVIATIREFSDLAPLHNPPNLTGIEAASKVLPGVPQVAVFDTAFHQSIPEKAYIYPLPYEYYEKYRVRRYGFHGTSHHYVAKRAAAMLEKSLEKTNVITCHLGNGCSITAVRNGKSVDTSMGLTPLEGVAMGTRCGDIDPAIIFYLMAMDESLTPEDVNNILNKKSGLLGISQISNDMRNLVDEAGKGVEKAQLALDIFAYKIRKYVGSYMAVLGRVDAIIFTGGIGENNPFLRTEVLSGLSALGIQIDEKANYAPSSDERDIATEESRSHIFVIPTNEEGYIAEEAFRLAEEETAAK